MKLLTPIMAAAMVSSSTAFSSALGFHPSFWKGEGFVAQHPVATRGWAAVRGMPASRASMNFDRFEAAWDQRLEELRLVAKANGGVAHVPRSDPEWQALGAWCHMQARDDSPPYDS